MYRRETVLPVLQEHILPAAIRDHVVPVRIYELTSAAINMLTARLVLQQEAAPLIHARRDIIQNAAEDADNVRQVVPLVTNITAPPANRGTRWHPDLIRAFPITESVYLTAGLRPDQDPTRDHLPQAEAEVVQAAQHIKQMSEYAAPIQPHTPAVFLMISEGRAPTVLNVQEDCALRAILLPDNT